MTETDTTDVQPSGIKTPKKRKKKFDYDGFWKNFIKRFFYPLLKRALPELYEAADREVEPEFLDKEFTDVLNTADPKIHTSPRFADYVLKVPLKNGGEEWILLHIEVQGHGGSASLAVRMRTYGSLIFAHYQKGLFRELRSWLIYPYSSNIFHLRFMQRIDFQLQVFLVTKPIRPALHHSDFRICPF